MHVKAAWLDTVQDFLIKLGIKPLLFHILKISLFSRNHVIVRPTKIMNNLLKVYNICTFKVIFAASKINRIFLIFLFLWILNFSNWSVSITPHLLYMVVNFKIPNDIPRSRDRMSNSSRLNQWHKYFFVSSPSPLK